MSVSTTCCRRHFLHFDGELNTDEFLPEDLACYFTAAWQSAAPGVIPRAVRMAERLKRIAQRAKDILFICEWRLWPFVACALEQQTEPEDEVELQLNCAIVPEDPLLLWQAGYLDDLPALTFASQSDNDFHKLDCLREIVERVHAPLAGVVQSSLLPACNLLEPAFEQFGPNVSSKLAAACLDFPRWNVDALAAADFPQFGLLTKNGIESSDAGFTPPDILKCERLYPCAHTESLRFYPPREAQLRRYWGPRTAPLTRSEATVMLSDDERWSVAANHQAMALAAEIMQEEGRRVSPSVATDLFTPAAWIFCSECDGDHRSLLDSNAAFRRHVQLGDMADATNTTADVDEQPDTIHTLSATRCAHGVTCVGVTHDLASGIGLVYTGPECGPERFRIVTQSGRPVPANGPKF